MHYKKTAFNAYFYKSNSVCYFFIFLTSSILYRVFFFTIMHFFFNFCNQQVRFIFEALTVAGGFLYLVDAVREARFLGYQTFTQNMVGKI